MVILKVDFFSPHFSKILLKSLKKILASYVVALGGGTLN